MRVFGVKNEKIKIKAFRKPVYGFTAYKTSATINAEILISELTI